MRFADLTPTAQAKAKSNFLAAKEVLTDYEIRKSIVKVTAIFVRMGEEIVYEMTFSKSGILLKEVIESKRYI